MIYKSYEMENADLKEQIKELEGKIDIQNKKLLKLKQLILLCDPVVSKIIVEETQLKQWGEFIKCFPDEGYKND